MNWSIYVDCFVTNTCIKRMPSESTINSLSFLQLAFPNNRLCCCFWQTSTFEIGRFCIVTTRQWSWEKVMFSVVCVCQSVFSQGVSHHTGPQDPFCTRPWPLDCIRAQRQPPSPEHVQSCLTWHSPDTFKLFHYEACSPRRRQWAVGILLECFLVFGSFGKMSKCRQVGCCNLWATLQV